MISILAVLADRDRRGRGACTRCAADFNPRGPCGPRRATVELLLDRLIISILAVLADRDRDHGARGRRRENFNPRGPCGPRPMSRSVTIRLEPFQSSRSLRTATPCSATWVRMARISILAVLADRDHIGLCAIPPPMISILAVLADRDRQKAAADAATKAISILAVLADRDSFLSIYLLQKWISILAVLADRDH